MKRILFFSEAASLAHVSRPFVLAESLDRQYCEIHFAVSDRYAFVFSGSSPVMQFHSMTSITPDAFMEALRQGAPIYSETTLASYVEEDMSILRKVRPDLVVGDFRLSLSISARLSRTPYVAITNAHWSPYSTRRRLPFPEHPLGTLLGSGVAGILFNLVRPIVLARHAAPLNRIRRKYGMTPLNGLREAYTDADLTLYADIPELVPSGPLPPHHRYIGPILWSPDVPKPAWWSNITDDERCIYVTLGSTGSAGALPAVIEGIAGLPVTVLLATAGRETVGNLPRNVRVAEYLPGLESARRSALVICNGGSATAYQSLAAGRPIIGIPSNLDQHLTMASIVEFGAGMMLRPEPITADAVRRSVCKALEDARLAERASTLRDAIAAYDAGLLFAGYASALMRGGKAGST